MHIPILHIYNPANDALNIQPADFRDRLMAHLIDAFLLGILHSILLYYFSAGRLFSVWLSPVFPLFLIQPDPGYVFHLSDWWWGGFAVPFKFQYTATIYAAIPDLISITIYYLYFSVMYFLFGQTPGKMVRGIALLSGAGERPNARQAVVYYLGYVLSILLLGSGFLSIWGKDKKTLAEVLSDLRVFRIKKF